MFLSLTLARKNKKISLCFLIWEIKDYPKLLSPVLMAESAYCCIAPDQYFFKKITIMVF